MMDETAENGTKRRRLVTFLGPADYNAVLYNDPRGLKASVKTRFVAYALTQFYDLEEIDILSTPEVFETNSPTGENFALLKERLEKDKNGEGKGWSRFDQGNDRSRPLRTYRCVELGRGIDGASLWEQFDTIKEICNPAERDVFVDITHGFRSFGFLTGAVAGFLQLTSKTGNRPRFFYGAYEEDRDEAPILDVSLFAEILAWAAAINVFNLTGRAAHLGTVEGPPLLAELAEESAIRFGSDKQKILHFQKALRAYSADFETLRTGRLLLGLPPVNATDCSSAEELYHAIEKIEGAVNRALPPIGNLLDETKCWLGPFMRKDGQPDTLAVPAGHKLTSALAQRYVDVGRYMEAITTVREGMYNFGVSDDAGRPGHSGCTSKSRQLLDNAIGEATNILKQEEDKTRIFDEDDKRDRKVFSSLRNQLDHAGYQAKPIDSKRISILIDRTVKGFSSIDSHGASRKMEEAMRMRKPNIVLNVSNHKHSEWPEEQKIELSRIIPFSQVEVFDLPQSELFDFDLSAIEDDNDERLMKKSGKILKTARRLHGDDIANCFGSAIVQGEYTATFLVVQHLIKQGIRCYSAIGERSDRHFVFKRFREYQLIR